MGLMRIWCLYGYADGDIEPSHVTYALTFQTLPHGGWRNQGMVEKARTAFFAADTMEYRAAINNTQHMMANNAKR